MALSDRTEVARVTIQVRLDSAKTQIERNRLGQFATPTALATSILEYARTLLPSSVEVRFLDPAFGTGSFYSALLRVFSASRIAAAVGYEIDPHYGREALHFWGDTSLKLNIADFTRARPPESDGRKANLIICNPPYVRHHHLSSEEKLRLQRVAEQITGLRLNGLSGLYCYFLCISHAWLAKDGLAGWLIPSEFMDVNYGERLRQYLLNQVTLLRIHRFDPHDLQFEDALVSSAVVWFRQTPPPTENHLVEFTYGGSLVEPKIVRSVSTDVLRGAAKWNQFSRMPVGKKSDIRLPKLSDLFKIQRGVATGANKFFVLTPEQVINHRLPAEFLTPILPGPRYLSLDEIEADSDGEPLLDRKLYLLGCNLSESVVKRAYPSLWEYLQMGMEAGINERYLCKHRTPWYAQEHRPPSVLLCTYMGRQNAGNGRPFRFILNHSKAIAPNVYLMLYPKPILVRELHGRPDRLKLLWQALNKIPLETLIGEGRVYGGGLHKMEPKELGNSPAQEILAALPDLASSPTEQMLLFSD